MKKAEDFSFQNSVESKFLDAIETIIDNNNKHLPTKLLKSMKEDNINQFRKEFLTVSVNLPRRMGNTTIALELLKKHKKSIYVAPTIDMIRDTMFTEFKDRVFSVLNKDFMGKKIDIVIVDPATYCKQLDNVYSIDAKWYIFLG
jgi:adenylate kinase family enzyme